MSVGSLPPAKRVRHIPRVLVVDDHDDLAASLCGVLSNAAFEGAKADVKRTATGAEALVAADVYDVLIVDIKLPDMSGVELLRELKHRNGSSEVIVITGRVGKRSPLPASRLDANSWAKGTFGRLGQPIEPLNPGSSPSHRGTSRPILSIGHTSTGAMRGLRHVAKFEPAKHSAPPIRRPSWRHSLLRGSRSASRWRLGCLVNTLDVSSDAPQVGDDHQQLHAALAWAAQNIEGGRSFQ